MPIEIHVRAKLLRQASDPTECRRGMCLEIVNGGVRNLKFARSCENNMRHCCPCTMQEENATVEMQAYFPGVMQRVLLAVHACRNNLGVHCEKGIPYTKFTQNVD